MGVSKNNGTPKSSNLIGFSIMFTIHFGVFPRFLETPKCFWWQKKTLIKFQAKNYQKKTVETTTFSHNFIQQKILEEATQLKSSTRDFLGAPTKITG